jgi:hypothetical protein
MEQQRQLDILPEYRSRGKGGKFGNSGSRSKVYRKMLRQRNHVITNTNSVGLLEHIWVKGNGRGASALAGMR